MAGILAAGFTAGWTTKTWQSNSAKYIAEQAAAAAVEKKEVEQAEVAKHVEKRLQELRANERTIEKHIPKIIDRPIYNVECIDNDGLDIINGKLFKPETSGD
jgi:hypothetical protein